MLTFPRISYTKSFTALKMLFLLETKRKNMDRKDFLVIYGSYIETLPFPQFVFL